MAFNYKMEKTTLSPRGTLYPQTLALTSLTSGGRSVDIACSRTQATEFSFSLVLYVDTSRVLGSQIDCRYCVNKCISITI
jgi:hypothetical protein